MERFEVQGLSTGQKVFGHLVRSCKSGTAGMAGMAGMFKGSEIVKEMGEDL